MNYKKNPHGFWYWISYILIWLPLFPTLVTDVLFEIYHRVSFPAYGIELVPRKKYIQVLDRNKLQYLSWNEKLGCMYCGYMNGWYEYAAEICHRTEKYWCGIMHENKNLLENDHQLQQDFAEFGNKEDFKKKYTQNNHLVL